MGDTGLMFFLAALPVVLILIFVYKKDKNKEPLLLLLELFGLGIASCFLVLSVSGILQSYFPVFSTNVKEKTFVELLIYCFVGVALLEEFCKWIMVYFKGYKSKEFDELYDIIVYSVFVSLGFAFFENLFYVFSNKDITVAIIRGLSAIPGHACDAIFMGYYLTLAKQFAIQNRKDLERRYILLSILIPAILHGIYDFCLFSNYNIFLLVFIVFIIYLYSISIKKLKMVAANNRQISFKSNYCSNCGEKVIGKYCTKCGHEIN